MMSFGDSRICDRLWDSLIVAPSGCWIWGKYLEKDGYARVCVNWKRAPAHRYFYQIASSRTLTADEVCDHLCRNRACCNPSHIEIVKQRENVTRGAGASLKPGKVSKHVGVCWHKHCKKWVARIVIDGKLCSLGYFHDQERAREAYTTALRRVREASI